VLPIIFEGRSLGPWFPDWNYRLMEFLFRIVPHSVTTDKFFQLLVKSPLASTWIFGASFYILWTIPDDKKVWRRTQLFLILLALSIAVLITFGFRPWIAWPAPARTVAFQSLFPPNLRGHGTGDCFPSHATLAYTMVAMGLWRLHRGISMALAILVLPLIAIPRIYVGGHYPIDILASLVLGVIVLLAVWQWSTAARLARWLTQVGGDSQLRELLFFLWVFELANGFSGTGYVLRLLFRTDLR
jgi:membrane-associated phospholipid phosphatase